MNKNYIYLSHFLSESTPTYGKRDQFTIKRTSCIDHGDTANSHALNLSTNHMGTHIDLPKHFFDKGQSLNDFDPSYWFYNHVSLINLSKNNGDLILPEDLDSFSLDPKTEILLIKTGFEKFRDKDIYWKENPGVAPSLANYLQSKCPNIRTLGFDFISLTSFQHRSIGKEAHQAFLNPDKPITIIEDMHLEEIMSSPINLNVFPLLVKDIDSSPVNVIALLDK
jgi:kynurenine formamidase